MNIVKEYRNLPIFVKNKRIYNKTHNFIYYMIHLENVLRLIAIWEEHVYGTCYITSNKYQFPKLFTNSLCFSKTDNTIQEYISHVMNIKQVIGGVYVESVCHKVAREIKSVIALRTKGEKASLPRPKSITKRNYFTFSIGYYNYSLERLKNSNKLIIRLGSTRGRLSHKFNIRIPKQLAPKHLASEKEIPIAPEIKITWIKDVGLIVNISYQIQYVPNNISNDNFLSIDLGYKNTISAVSNVLPNAFIISGKPLNSFLYWITKTIANLQSEGHNTRHIFLYYKRVMHKFMNYLVNQIIDLCVINNISKIIIGDITSIYQNKSKGNFNQAFRKIPFGYFISQIFNKAKVIGITVIKQDEAYTSQLFCLNHKVKAKRCKGIIRIRKFKKSFHADINAAWNIAQKTLNIKDYIQTNVNFILKTLSNPIKIKNYNPLNPLFGLNHFIMGRIKKTTISING